jgi:beta-glucosidase
MLKNGMQNGGAALPLAASVRRLAVVGPLAAATGEMRGPWWAAGTEANNVNVVDGLRSGLPAVDVLHAPGVAIEDEDCSGIAAAVELCQGADAIVLCLGEAAVMSGEAASRADPDLPGAQRALAEAVAGVARARKLPLIVILFSGRPLIVPWLAEQADALLAAWFLGCEAGNAIADVVSGRTSPSGRTPMSWPRTVGQVPVFFAQRPTGRPADPKDKFTSKYLDVANEPLYPFGHGLTYGQFSLGDVQVTPQAVGEGDTISAQVRVTNTGVRAAEETVFLFTRDKIASVARPLLELKGFAKIALQPGQSGIVRMTLAAAELRFLGEDLTPVFEPGEVEILVGPCADRAQLLVASVLLRG